MPQAVAVHAKLSVPRLGAVVRRTGLLARIGDAWLALRAGDATHCFVAVLGIAPSAASAALYGSLRGDKA